ncbi:hypothetical protein NDU88_008856 [Pleurodeles waltl]|uniref:Uncharacterized protein n=1 Tax=Pleurodeles waltl TaxID=8319 RepID=A0AAV7RUD4_PLEWA|nr:hypothetical protein NDU88_008856 [Pleurodeles waltl]
MSSEWKTILRDNIEKKLSYLNQEVNQRASHGKAVEQLANRIGDRELAAAGFRVVQNLLDCLCSDFDQSFCDDKSLAPLCKDQAAQDKNSTKFARVTEL